MTPERDRQISALFHAACELTSEQRAAFLTEACAGDDELRREVEQLLIGDERAGDFLNRPVDPVAAGLLAGSVAASAPLPAGRRIGHYQIVSRLGAGGMGEVYLAQDMQLDRRVAIKLLPAEFMAQPERVRRFIREAKAASALNHPNILTVHEIGQVQTEAGDLHFIVAEYVVGQTLRERMVAGNLPLDAALDVAIQVAGALSAAHEAGVVHRDIKPENLMLRRDGYVKVLDFGLAKLTGLRIADCGLRIEENETPALIPSDNPQSAIRNPQSTTPGMVMGTAYYMSPEQARGLRVDARTDIFSLGVVLYEMIAGQAPFGGVNAIEVMGAILNREPAPLPPQRAPRELERIVAKALRKDRDERYQTSKDLLIDLKDLRHELEFQAEFERKTHSDASAAVKSGQTSADTARIEAADTHKTAVHSTGAPIERRKPALALTLAAIVAVAGLGFGLYQFIVRNQTSTRSVPRIVPFTSFPGVEFRASFSPDGNQLAFDWNGEKEDNYDIYVKLLDSSALLRLTTNPARDYCPAWSPDGRSIAFLRSVQSESIQPAMDVYLVSALGGAERKLAGGIRVEESPSLSWSPDGNFLAFGDKSSPDGPGGIVLLEVATGEKRKLTNPPAQTSGDSTPAFSPDGRTLAFVRWVTSGVSDLYLAPAAGGEPKRITFDKATIRGLAWTPDGEEIVFASERRGVSSLWRISARGGEPELVEAIGSSVQYPVVSPRGDRLAFTQLINDTNIYRADLAAPASRRPAGVKFLASTLEDDSPQFSPDGKSIVFGSTRSGSTEIWLCDSEGQQLRQLTSMGGPLTGTPRWSPDSRQIAFDSRSQGNADIYVISVEGGAPRRLTTEASEDVVPSWSQDGRWVYFCSNRSGRREIYKLPVEGGQAVQVTTQGGFECFESPDGKFLYYTKRSYDSTLWRRAAAGGEEALAFNSDRLLYTRNWAVIDQGIYFASSDSVIEFFNLAIGKATPVATIEKRLTRGVPGLAVSPDRRWMLYAQIEQQGSDIMLMENFR